MSRIRSSRFGGVAVAVLIGLFAASCGNSGDDDTATTTTSPPSDDTTETTPADGDRDTFVSIDGVPGVSDETITFSVIGTKSGNPLGTCILDCYIDGIEAYFAFRNSEGGLYGRQLEVGDVLDDELGQNQVRALEVVTAESSFGNFNATLLASGWGDLDDAGVPTYTWGIHGEANGRSAIFPSIASICGTCTVRGVPYIAREIGATKAASIGYGVSPNSLDCAVANQASFDKYEGDSGVEAVYLAEGLDFGLPNGIGPEVTAMKEAGVDFIAACIDLNGMKTLAQELQRQDMDDVVLYHPNTYNEGFVAEAEGIFDGDVVAVAFRPFQADPGDSALGDYLEWLDETGGEESELSMVGWINASLAFDGLVAAGPEFDRASVIAATNQLTSYDAGGLIVPIDWTRQHEAPTEDDSANEYVQECIATVRIVDGAFETFGSPDEPWLCWSNDTLDWAEPTPTDF